ncbi:MAG: AAA family ATPase [Candidatus Thermoplasmatota archaeon]|nr:AAA family ATPase [Candidatus Thermoplasmatota archaeon]
MKKERYLQIFHYLLEFSKIRSKPVRDITNATTQYIEVIWFSDFPQTDRIDWILKDGFNEDSGYWLKISKPVLPEPPKFPYPPQPLKQWIIEDTLFVQDDFPKLKESIIDNENHETIYLSDNPDIEQDFVKYLDDKWFRDSEKYWEEHEYYKLKLKDYEESNSFYKKLFILYNKTQQFGEEFEFVLGLGLLNFKENDDTPLICRHIFTYRIEINFEYSQNDSSIIISPNYLTQLQIETDAIIDLDEQFDSDNIIDAERDVLNFAEERNLESNPFNELTKEMIQRFANRFRHDGIFKDELEKPTDLPTIPTIVYAPALILRKRNTRSFTAVYEKIIDNIKNDSNELNIHTLNDIIGIEDGGENGDDNGISGNSYNEVNTIYFPKEYNDEQLGIIFKAQKNNKVLVQGPPGTGKSHTIANLICHFLANGKKILITAYTKRALEVLKQKLPEDFKNLTVNLLGGDSSSIQDLEASVNEINDKLSSADFYTYENNIDEYKQDLHVLKENQSMITNKLLNLKEQEIRKQVINENYHGLLIEIAQKLEADRVKFDWFKDDYSDINNNEIIAKIKNFITLNQHYQTVDCNEFEYEVPDIKELFTPSEFNEFADVNAYLLQCISLESDNLIVCSDHFQTKKLLDSLYNICLEIEKKKQTKISSIHTDVKKNSTVWAERIKKSKEILNSLRRIDLGSLDRNVEILYPKDMNLRILKNDANKLLHYLKSGGKLDGVLFKFKKYFLPNEIKEKLYLIDSVRVNGNPCNKTWELSSVIEDIRIQQLFEDLAKIWDAKIKNLSKNYEKFFEAFDRLQAETTGLLNSLNEANKLATEISKDSSIRIQDFESDKIKELIHAIEINYYQKKFKEFNSRKEHILFYLSDNSLHPISIHIKNVITKFDTIKYQQLIDEIEDINFRKNQYVEFKKIETELKSCVPILIYMIIEGTFNNDNIKNLEDAILYKHAKKEVQKLLDKDDEDQLIADLKSYESREKKLIAKISSLKAWVHVLSNLQQNKILRQHLTAWVQAVRKIGKTGRGKRALKFRQEAQKEMEYCKTTVPCWIMPLYKVTETISPEQGIYDYVIIDEASQLGPDALFLFYISKKIIIVGDDKQTSPEYVGISPDTMDPFIRKHLKGIPFANFYGIDFSIFDHAKRFCDGLIVLREHFRCMPEIIEFSNKLFYAPDGKGLYPLKQYSENRLEPLEHVFCEKGYIEGIHQNIINRVEAELIVRKISELVNDDCYNGKTFGVISLQGHAQGPLIENILLKEIGEKQFKERKIVCGNSASFQGDERDVIFLSLVTAHNHNRNALTRPEDERRFNVAVSRAVEQIWLFHSVQLEDLSNTSDLRYKLLDHFINYKPQTIPLPERVERKPGKQPEPFESWFEVDVHNDIVSHGYSVIPQYEVVKGKYRIDLVLILDDGTKMAIECDGDKWHSAEQFQNDLMRQKVLERCGWQFFRVRGGEYYANRIKALEPLWEILNGRQKNHKHELNLEKKKETIDANLNEHSYFQKINDSPTPNIPNDASEILIFTNMYNVYKIKDKFFNDHQHLMSSIELERNEKIIFKTNTSDFMGYMLFGFENGKVAKIFMESYKTETQRKRLKNAYNHNSRLVFIDYIENDVVLVAISSINKVVIFNTAQIIPKESRTCQGNQVMKPKNSSIMKSIKQLNQVRFKNIEYYRKNIPATGSYLKSGDKF